MTPRPPDTDLQERARTVQRRLSPSSTASAITAAADVLAALLSHTSKRAWSGFENSLTARGSILVHSVMLLMLSTPSRLSLM